MSSVTIGMTTKGINSTSRVMSGGVSLDCRLKEPCGLHSPTFAVKGLSKSYNNYNYCTWRGMYYWVDEIVFLTNDIQEVHCHLDPLATYKGAIDDTYAYVQYGDKANWNKYIDDPRINPEREYSVYTLEDEHQVIPNYSDTGTIVMTFMDCGNGGGFKTVAMLPSTFLLMLDDLYSLFSSATVEEIYAYMGGCGSWRDNIMSCIWVPFSYSSIPGSGTTGVRLGGVYMAITVKYLAPNYIVWGTGSWSLNWSDFDIYPFLRNERWTSLQVVTPIGYSAIPIDTLVNQSELFIKSALDITTGDFHVKFSESADGDGQVYACFSGNVALDVMRVLGNGHGFGQATASAMGFAGKIGMAAASLGMSIGGAQFTQNTVDSGQLGGGTSSIAAHNVAAANVRQTTVSSGINALNAIPSVKQASCASGSIGGGPSTLYLTSTKGNAFLVRKTFGNNDISHYYDMCNKYGWPCNAYLKLGSISGYCQCSGAFIDNIPGATQGEIATINSCLNSGIIIED
jgi:hypothetical protein